MLTEIEKEYYDNYRDMNATKVAEEKGYYNSVTRTVIDPKGFNEVIAIMEAVDKQVIKEENAQKKGKVMESF